MKEDLEELCHISEEEVRAIRHYKLKEIRKAWDDLFFIGIAPELYKNRANYTDYKTFEEGFRKKFDQIYRNNQSITEEILLEEDIFNGIKGVKEDLENEMDMLLSLEFIPPQDWRNIANLLQFLITYFGSNIYFPSIEMRLDLSLCKLMKAIGELSVIAGANGAELARVKKSTSALKSRVEEKKTYVYEIYYRSNEINEGMNLHTVATIIRDEFIKKQEEGTIPKYLPHPNRIMGKNMYPCKKTIKKPFRPPKITMIKEYLFENEKIRKDFKKKGRSWIIGT